MQKHVWYTCGLWRQVYSGGEWNLLQPRSICRDTVIKKNGPLDPLYFRLPCLELSWYDALCHSYNFWLIFIVVVVQLQLSHCAGWHHCQLSSSLCVCFLFNMDSSPSKKYCTAKLPKSLLICCISKFFKMPFYSLDLHWRKIKNFLQGHIWSLHTIFGIPALSCFQTIVGET